ncbi:DUF4113 domain-containing protein [Plasticicumulans lactativorans]|uniref:DUF4113 domain-containing protein n=1 Tax=Plasticicumulans lactativorans TaxID=1133106 RepID=UPI001051FE72
MTPGHGTPGNPRSAWRSPCYTTRWSDLMTVRCTSGLLRPSRRAAQTRRTQQARGAGRTGALEHAVEARDGRPRSRDTRQGGRAGDQRPLLNYLYRTSA